MNAAANSDLGQIDNKAAAGIQRPWGWALLWGALLAVVFFGTYNNVNRYTASLEPVTSFYFSWETAIPFWPWTIVPYWSIDLLYGAALFLALDKAMLFRLVKRLLLAQGLCITGFLLFPLKFSFVRPATEGVFGSLFHALGQFDLPYNQAPSLHIVLLVILWRQYLLYAPGRFWPCLVHGWSLLIGLSVLTTWQHHAIDLITGLWVGAFCVLAIPEQPQGWQQPAALERPQRYRLARYYLAGALLFAGLGGWLWPGLLAALCYWIAVALAYVALVYWRGTWAHLGKTMAGYRPWIAYGFLAPYYWGAQLSAHWHLRGHAVYNEIAEGIFLGSLYGVAPFVQQQGDKAHILDLTAELAVRIKSANYFAAPQLDLLPLGATQLQALAEQVEQQRQQGALLVACALGVARSAAVVAAWLICYRGYTAESAEQQLRACRPWVKFSSAQRVQLQQLPIG